MKRLDESGDDHIENKVKYMIDISKNVKLQKLRKNEDIGALKIQNYIFCKLLQSFEINGSN